MIPGQFDYVRPGSLGETLQILKDREGDAKLLSGGYSLIPLIKLRLAQPALLVDLQDVSGLDGIVETDDHLVIGARATHRQIHDNEIVQDRYPGIVDITSTIGDPQVRNWGTIGGSVAHADPASDWPAFLLGDQRDDRLHEPGRRASDRRTRLLPRHLHDRDRADRGPDRDPGLPPADARPAAPTRSSSARSATSPRSASPPSSGWTPTGRIEGSGIGVTGVASTPFAATDAEAILVGNAPSDDALPPGRRGGRRAEPIRAATSAVPSNTSGRWPRR